MLSNSSHALQTVASNLFASSIIPYAGFLYHLQKSKKAPRLTLIGFRFLLVFVLATIIAGVYGKSHSHEQFIWSLLPNSYCHGAYSLDWLYNLGPLPRHVANVSGHFTSGNRRFLFLKRNKGLIFLLRHFIRSRKICFAYAMIDKHDLLSGLCKASLLLDLISSSNLEVK